MRIGPLIKRMFALLSPRERVLAIACAAGFVISALYLIAYGVRAATILVPANGGSYTEGMVGQVAFVNPILTRPGSADADLVSLLFAPITDIAESIKHSDDFKTWNIRIKEGAAWHDGKPITSDDIIFTVALIQNPDTLSPLITDWQNIDVSRVSERELSMRLKQPYAAFEVVLAGLRPIPKHLFESVAPANVRLSKYNLEPIGSGPFQFDSSSINDEGFVESFTLTRNEQFKAIGHPAYLDSITLKFYKQEDELIRAYNIGQIEGIFTTNPLVADALRLRFTIHDIPALKYYAVFFNQSANKALAYAEVRAALSAAIDTEAIVQNIFKGHAQQMNGPLPPALNIEQKRSQPDTPQNILANAGWKKNEETGIWEKTIKKETISLAFVLSIPDTEPLRSIAQELRDQWQKAGISVTIDAKDLTTLTQESINTRNYQMLLFGNILLEHPDLFHFWNSTEKFYPGLNFSLYQNSSVDALIKTLKRISVDDERRSQYLEDIARHINADMPAIFLVSPNYLYITRPTLHGIPTDAISLPYERFDGITNWYIKTKRVLK